MMLVTDLQYTWTYPTIDNLPKYATAGTPAVLIPVPLPPVTTTAGLPSPAAAPTPREILHAYRVAQWAVNVVDFRDRDAIMTWFEFDIRPFVSDVALNSTIQSTLKSSSPSQLPPNSMASSSQYIGSTWEVDGLLSRGTTAGLMSFDDIQPYRGLVWGMEYPDLLITETTAFHDKALADSLYDTSAPGQMGHHGTQSTPTANRDADFDQIRLPQGSLFVELYCTGRPNTPGWPTMANAPPPTVQGGGSSYLATNYPAPNLPYYPPELYDVINPIMFPPVTAGTNNPRG